MSSVDLDERRFADQVCLLSLLVPSSFSALAPHTRQKFTRVHVCGIHRSGWSKKGRNGTKAPALQSRKTASWKHLQCLEAFWPGFWNFFVRNYTCRA